MNAVSTKKVHLFSVSSFSIRKGPRSSKRNFEEIDSNFFMDKDGNYFCDINGVKFEVITSL